MDNMYYRSSSRYSRRSRRGRMRKLKFLKPLIAIFAIIVAFWLLGQIWGFFANLISSDLDSPATVYVVQGKSQVQSFGSTDFAPVLSGQLLLEGDRVRTLSGGRAVIELFNGTLVRLDEGTDVSIESIDKGDANEEVKIKINAGDIWVNKPNQPDVKSTFIAATDYMNVKAAGTIFAVTAGLPEQVRVIDNEVLVEVIDQDQTLDQITVSVGQELVLDIDSYEAFQRRETPSVLDALDINFRQSGWFKYNQGEDSDPSTFAADPALSDGSGTLIESENPATDSDLNVVDEFEFDDASSSVGSPEVTSPAFGSTQTDETINIIGNAPEGAEKIMVTSFEDGSPNPYILKGFQPGDSTFKYIAKYDGASGNLVVGENRFEVVAIDADGNEGETTTHVFNYELSGDVEVEAPEELSAPIISEINDQPAGEKFVLTEDRAVVSGSVGAWAKDVVVNDFTLQQYTEFSGSFTYILSSQFGNLQEGDNVLKVVARDADGNESPALEFTITYNPAE